MKIAIVCFNLSWQSGGPRLIFSAAQALKRAGHSVRIYAPEFSGAYYKELYAGLDVVVVSEAGRELLPKQRANNLVFWIRGKIENETAQLRAAKKIASAIDRDTDILNVHDLAFPTAYFYKKLNPGAKVIWTSNDPPYAYVPKASQLKDALARLYHTGKERAAKKYFGAIDDVTVLDEYNKTWAEERGLRPTIVRLGVDFEKFYLPVKDFLPRAREKKVTLFGLGSLNSYRHYEDILLAVAELRRKGYDARARIISSDMWNEKAYREKILAVIREQKLEASVDIQFTGVPESGLMDAYRESDFFVYPMYVPPPRDGFGFSIGVFEAMAAGLPVVLCRTTTSVEVLEDGKSALFVDPESPMQIAAQIESVFEHPERYAEIASAGQEIVRTKLTWEQYIEGVLALFEK